jgi:hypothetical protein
MENDNFQISKNFMIHDKLSIKLNRNDFEDLGSIIQISLLSNSQNFIAISFYDHNQIQLPQNQLVLLTNYETIFFDNIILINLSNKVEAVLKLLNKEIYYMKMFTISFSFVNKVWSFKNYNNLINLYQMELLDNKEQLLLKQKVSQMINTQQQNKIEQNGINLIIEELNRVNQSLISEKEELEKSKQSIKNKEEKINQQITNFKKDIMLYSDKFYNDSCSKITSKISEIGKKIQLIETNNSNKMKLFKDKISLLQMKESAKVEKNESQLNKEKFANYEIKIKNLEDNINILKLKLVEKDESIKVLHEAEEKSAKLIKKLKEENVLLNSKIKELQILLNNKEIKEAEVKFKEESNDLKKEKKPTSKQSFGITKNQVQEYTEYFVTQQSIVEMNLFIQKIIKLNKKHESNEEYHSISNDRHIDFIVLLSLNIATNPVNLFNKFPLSFIFLVKSLIDYVIKNESDISSMKKTNLSFKIKESINSNSSIKRTLLDNNINKSNNDKEEIGRDLINLNSINLDDKNQISFSQIISSKIHSFIEFLVKNEKKYLDKNSYSTYKLVYLSSSILQIIFLNNINDIIDISKDIFDRVICLKDYSLINYLLYVNYFDIILFLISQSLDNVKTTLLCNILLDSVLFLHALDYDIFIQNFSVLIKQNKILIKNLKDNLTNPSTSITHLRKVIIFISILCSTTPSIIELFQNELSCLKEKNDDIIFLNIKQYFN